MNKDKRELEYPAELESQFILKLPEHPAKILRELLKSGENLKNRLTIQIDNDMRRGEVRLDHWLMHAKIIDLPTIVESLKTIDGKSFYKTADICQMMICKDGPDQPIAEEEIPTKNKKKDPYKVDKKYLWPHGVTPPTKNVRKRRFRKTLKKKFVEAPEIEKEVKRLLRADNEAISFTWEVIKEEDESNKPEPTTSKNTKPEKKSKTKRGSKRELTLHATKPESSNIVDIFGGGVSDSDFEDETVNVDLQNSRLSVCDSRLSGNSTNQSLGESLTKSSALPIEFGSHMFQSSQGVSSTSDAKCDLSSEDDGEFSNEKDDMALRINQLKLEVDELKQRRQKIKLEISGIENLALRQRFQDNLHTLNQDIMYKEMEYQGLLTLQNSEDI
ncbi:transcription initiation factor TFIID subunit 7 [Bombyx mori]|uniref:TAFII55 protein conserved region domain-containing protein n=1 Tax=Bombyx mori TaxID=7091 RepID=A0A8R1WJ93_BOMMO|nr:transcription initiation factor TFIID subunit 7 [Bombyx mori]